MTAGGNHALAQRARVLVIDDEPYIGRSVRLVLQPNEVVAVTSGSAALDLFRKGARFDVIFCDLMMPEMSGMAVYDEIARLVPEQAERIVFLSGGGFSPAVDAFFARVSNLRVDKPFDPSALRELVKARTPQADV